MQGAIRLGRLLGILVEVHWSLLVIFAIIAWNLATATFPIYYPGYPAWTHWLAGLIGAVVFLLGLLAHELAHAVVARRNGIAVDKITLWLLGGVAQLRSRTPGPGVELRVAGVGPLVSLLIGVAFAGIAYLLIVAGVSGPQVGFFAWLAGTNVLLAAFNLIPAAPLDGGRLLHAALWRWRGNRLWASVAASRTGRLFGFLLVAYGVWEFVRSAAASSLWPVILGWFIARAAGAEEQQARVDDALESLRVGEVMTRTPETAPAEVNVADLIDQYVFRSHHSTYPLVKDGQVVGLVTLPRIKAVPPEHRARVRAEDIACPIGQVVIAHPDQFLGAVLPRLDGSAEGRALVFDQGLLVGILTPSDIARVIEQASSRRFGRSRSLI